MSRRSSMIASVAVVAIGGFAGTLCRYAVGETVADADRWPVATLSVNVAGSFVLGYLLELLIRRGAENPRRRAMRLGLGTGFLGGFTTFSSLAVQAERLLAEGYAATAAAYVAASLVLGLLACVLGIAAGAKQHAWRDRPIDPDIDGAT